jgi:hypothetical protein
MMITSDILNNSFFAFFYCLGYVIDMLLASSFAIAILITMIRLLAKKD